MFTENYGIKVDSWRFEFHIIQECVMRSLKKDILLIFGIFLCTVFFSFLLGTVLDYFLFQRNNELVKNYDKINQIVTAFTNSKTAFNLYNRYHDRHYLEEYEENTGITVRLFAEMEEELNQTWQCRLYYRIVMQMLEHRAECVEKFINFIPIAGSSIDDLGYIQIMNDYIETYINSLMSHYIDYLNHLNYEQTQNHQKIRQWINYFVFLIVSGLSFLCYAIYKNIIRSLGKINHVARELTANNFGVEDIPLVQYNEMNMFITTINNMKKAINQLIQEIKRYSEEKVEMEQQKRLLVEAKMKELQMQINPHFLFNTLSLIIRNIQRDEKENSILLVKSTSQLLRSSMEIQDLIISLDEEIGLLKSYINIQQIHFGNKVTFILDIRKTYSDEEIKVPPLIIQPIVENCLFHGLKDVTAGGIVNIVVTEYTRYVEVIVEDNGIGMDQKTIAAIMSGEAKSIGLSNVLARLKLHYKEEDVLAITSEPKKGTRVTMKLYK